MSLRQRDDAIEPGRRCGRAALGFRRAIVDPLNPISAAADARRYSLPVSQVIAVLNVISLTGGSREFNEKSSVNHADGALDPDRRALALGGSRGRGRPGAELGLGRLA